MRVEIYSDIVCPWCYIGKRRFTRALAESAGHDDVEVVLRPYQLDPNAPGDAVPLLEYLGRRFGRSAEEMTKGVSHAAAGEGLTIAWADALSVNTFTAHRLLRLAEREHGAAVQLAVADRLFDAHFSRGGDVSDHALLARLAEECGMSEPRVRAYLASDEGSAELQTELDESRMLGIEGVPTFVFEGQYAVNGAQPVAVFTSVLEQVRTLLSGMDNS